MSKFGPKGKTGAHGFQRYRPTPAELRKAVLAIPKDTRDVTGLVARRSAARTQRAGPQSRRREDEAPSRLLRPSRPPAA